MQSFVATRYAEYMIENHKDVYRFEDMIASLHRAINRFPDKRQGKNLHYTMIDAGAGAFSVFFTQSPSFLAHQRLLQEKHGISNARTLFGITDIPTDNHIRTVLDSVSDDTVHPVFNDCFEALQKSGHVDSFRIPIGNKNDLLIALDGTEYFSSHRIHCGSCSTKRHAGITTYSHGMINPVVVAPGRKQVIPLPPEFIVPQDGDTKQDCEHKAAKRWLAKHGSKYHPLCVTILGDDLYCHQPMIEKITTTGLNFILVCKPDSHKTLYEWLNGITDKKQVRRRNGKHWETWVYRYAVAVPLRDGDDALLVNWCEVTVLRAGKQVYKNAFVTNHSITDTTVETIVSCGRTRWKIENENNNTLKTKGYYLEHNYGHGKNHLASLLATMNILAFLFHTMLEFMNKTYRLLRVMSGRRDTFFNDIRALFKFNVYSSFDSMLQWMIDGLRQPHDVETITIPI